jgi:adenine-specific DNA-methyltransferase
VRSSDCRREPEMMPPVAANTITASELGPRGSRAAVAESDLAAELPEQARRVLAAVPGWWAARAAAAGLSGRWRDISQALDVAAPDETEGNEPDPAITDETTAHDLGGAYVGALAPQVRARHGRHYTPTELAEELWSMTRRALGLPSKVARRLPGLIRDPACGAGALLLPALQEHLAATRQWDPEVVITELGHLIEGIDIDPAAVWLANAVLAAEALPLLAAVPARRRRPLPALARVGDGLTPGLPPSRVTIMNPPYGRVRLSTAERERFATTVYGHANLYGLFIAAALEHLDGYGVLAAVIPTSFTAGRYFQNLRAVISDSAPLEEIAFVTERDGVFAGVLQETCLAVFSRQRQQHTVITSLNGSRAGVATVTPPGSAEPWLLPRRPRDVSVAAAAIAMPLTLTTAGWRASTGPLVWNRRRHDLYPRPGRNRIPIVWAADLDGGVLHRDQTRDQLRYLELTQPSDHAVMLLTQPAVLVQRTTAPEQSRRLVVTDLTPELLDEWGGASRWKTTSTCCVPPFQPRCSAAPRWPGC